MLGWPLTYAVSALLAAAFGFSGIEGPAETWGQIAFAVFSLLFVLSVLMRAIQGKPPI